MRNERGGGTIVMEHNNPRHRTKFGAFLNSDPAIFSASNVVEEADFTNNNNNNNRRRKSAALMSPNNNNISTPTSGEASPYMTSPWNQFSSPYYKSPWITPSTPYNNINGDYFIHRDGLIGSIVREEGHVYSLAASGDLLYTGSDSKNIRVWKNLKEYSGFKSKSGLVKAIVISGNRIFTGHQDGKIRIWKVSSKNPSRNKRVGSLPTLKDFVKSSVNPKNYVEVRRHRNVVRIRHFDAVSCLSLNEEHGLLYSGSWDKTLKIWRLSDWKCLESIDAHDDAINAVVSGFDGLAFTGSADGTVKAWKRDIQGKGSSTNHFLAQVLLRQETAVTALAVSQSSSVLYCGSSDGLVNFWERDQKHLLSHGGVLRGHKKAVLCLASGGNLVFSGSADKSICVWRREEESAAVGGGVHTCLSVLTGHTGPVKCLAVEEDEQNTATDNNNKGNQRCIVYSGSLDKSVKVWRVSEHAPSLKEVEGYYSRMSDANEAGKFSYSSPGQQTWQYQS